MATRGLLKKPKMKTETMCIDMLHRTNKHSNYRCLVITPYENQVRLIFMRLKELIDASPLLKNEVVKFTFSPFVLMWKNGSSILGFTTGAASGSGGASINKFMFGIYSRIIIANFTVIMLSYKQEG